MTHNIYGTYIKSMYGAYYMHYIWLTSVPAYQYIIYMYNIYTISGIFLMACAHQQTSSTNGTVHLTRVRNSYTHNTSM